MATQYKSFKIQSTINPERTRIVTVEQWEALTSRSQQWQIVERYEDDRTENATANKPTSAPVATAKPVKSAKGDAENEV